MTKLKQMRGVYAIPPTPFHKDGEIDETSLRNVIRFCLEAGAHGIVGPVNASEFISLTDDERQFVVRVIVEEVKGKIPVVAGISGTSVEHAVYHAKRAVANGANSLIAMPPYVRKAGPDEIVEYYQAIDAVCEGRPVWIQNAPPPVGTPMPPALLARIVQSTQHVNYVKEEVQNAGQYMTETFNLIGDKLAGIQGGSAGRYLMDEYARGACGTMPACEICDVHVQLWDQLEAGNYREARDLFNRMLPLLNLEQMYGFAVYKEVLYRRGIIESTYKRRAGHFHLDAFDQKELSAILDDLKPLFKL